MVENSDVQKVNIRFVRENIVELWTHLSTNPLSLDLGKVLQFCVFLLQKGNCSFISENFTRYPRKMELADVVSTDSGNKDPSKFVVTVGKNSWCFVVGSRISNKTSNKKLTFKNFQQKTCWVSQTRPLMTSTVWIHAKNFRSWRNPKKECWKFQ